MKPTYYRMMLTLGATCHTCFWQESAVALRLRHTSLTQKEMGKALQQWDSNHDLRLTTGFYVKCLNCSNGQWEAKAKTLTRKADLLGGEIVRCDRCKQLLPVQILTFHHVDQKQKKYNVGHILRHHMERARQEAQKCVPLCYNCHEITHWAVVAKPSGLSIKLQQREPNGTH